MSSSDKESAGPQRRSILKQIAAVAGLPFAPGLVSGVAAGAVFDTVTARAAPQAPQGNTMSYSGLTDPKQRADLVAYLQTLK